MNNKYKLTPEERELLIAFRENVPMFNAVHKVLLAGIYSNGVLTEGEQNPLQNWALSYVMNNENSGVKLSDEEIGKKIRASAEGISFLQNGLDHIKTIQRDFVPKPTKPNKAR